MDESAAKAVVNHEQRRDRDFASLRLRRERVFGDAANFGVFALELAAIFEEQCLAKGGAAACE